MPKKKKPIDPFAPRSEKQIRQQANQTVNPVVAELMRDVDRREQRGAQTIAASTNALASQLGTYEEPTRRSYAESTSRLAGVNDALAERVTGTGTSLSSRLAEMLKGTPNAQTISTGVVDTARGSANAGYATGSADLSELTTRSQSAQDYFRKLPGIGRLTGQQHLRDLRAGSADARADVRAYKAKAYMEQLNKEKDREWDKTLGRVAMSKTQAELAADAAEAAADAAGEAADDRKPNAALSKTYGYIVDSAGNPILVNGKRQPVSKTPPKVKADPTKDPATRRKAFYDYRDKAFKEADRLAKGTKIDTGETKYGKPVYETKMPTYQEAYDRLITIYQPRLVGEWGYHPQAVQTMIRKALAAAGIG